MCWNVHVSIECESRIPLSKERIDECIKSFLKRHPRTIRPGEVQSLLCQSDDSNWCIFCYFDTSRQEAEAVDAAPVQTSELGRKWFVLVESHFRAFGMPWRVRLPYEVYAQMVSAGRSVVDTLWSDVLKFMGDVDMDENDRERCYAALRFVEDAMACHHKAIDLGDINAAVRHLDKAVYFIHNFLYLAGEILDLVPKRGGYHLGARSIQPQEPADGNRRVFVVHGHDTGAKETVARFLEKLKLEPVILSEIPDGGDTIIVKLEQNAAGVQYAVVLLTGDDMAHLIGRPEEKCPRARQNVILELGYLVGRLSRKRVCVLLKDTVEMPSDYQGVLFIQMDDAGGWKLKLATEIKQAGLNVDLNLAV